MHNRINTKELKSIQVNILDKVHTFCLNHNITYFLSSGTLIGAVRHGGYIPWDDDIDLYMPRESYDRFISIYNNYDNGTRVRTLFSDNDYYYSFAKVEDIGTILIENDIPEKIDIGVNIDIFPIDGVPNNNIFRRVYFAKNKIIRLLLTAKVMNFDDHRSIAKQLIFRCLAYVCRGKKLRDLAHLLDASIDKSNNNSLMVCNLTAGNGLRSCFSRNAILESIDICFEGKIYKTMIGYDEYLKKTYGNYMQLPPIEKQKSHHKFDAYYK